MRQSITKEGSETDHATYNHGLALALSDEGQMTWEDAIDACSAKNEGTPVTGATWLLASKDQWTNMISAAGGYTALRTGFSSVGGSNLQEECYWSSTEYEDDADLAWGYDFFYRSWSDDEGKDFPGNRVRACLAF